MLLREKYYFSGKFLRRDPPKDDFARKTRKNSARLTASGRFYRIFFRGNCSVEGEKIVNEISITCPRGGGGRGEN